MKGSFLVLAAAILLAGCKSPETASRTKAGEANGATNPSGGRVLDQVAYLGMQGGFCTPTAVTMLLNAKGISAPVEDVKNLSWNYGFQFEEAETHVIAFPTTDPERQIDFATKSYGLTTTPVRSATPEEATRVIVQSIDAGEPVLVQWIPHTVLAVGYENDGATIILHDPEDTTSPEPADQRTFGKGAFAKYQPSQWLQPPLFWDKRQHLVVRAGPPPAAVPAIDWASVYQRNGRRTLGENVDEDRGTLGVAGVRAFAGRLEALLGANPFAAPMTFYFGRTSRQSAAAFLAARAAAEPSNTALSGAAAAFGRSTAAFQEGETLMNQYLQSGGRDSRLVSGMVAALNQVAAAEDEAGRLLVEAGGNAATPPAANSASASTASAGAGGISNPILEGIDSNPEKINGP